jgi:hypothetical protein
VFINSDFPYIDGEFAIPANAAKGQQLGLKVPMGQWEQLCERSVTTGADSAMGEAVVAFRGSVATSGISLRSAQHH